MNSVLNDIGKKMPYRESEDYLNDLVNAATEKAITRHASAKRSGHKGLMAISAAAVALVVIGFGIAFFNAKDAQQATMSSPGPLDEFLNTLSDEEASQLQFYVMEEIPEY